MNLVVFIHNIVFNFHVLKRNKIKAVCYLSLLEWKTCTLEFWPRIKHCSRSFLLATNCVTFNKSFNLSGLQLFIPNKWKRWIRKLLMTFSI